MEFWQNDGPRRIDLVAKRAARDGRCGEPSHCERVELVGGFDTWDTDSLGGFISGSRQFNQRCDDRRMLA